MPAIAIVSDIHGNLPALEAVADDIRARGIQTVFNLGDSLSGPLLPRETAAFLIDAGWASLAGNHERQLLALIDRHDAQGAASDRYAAARLDPAALAWLRTLPATLRHGELLLCHGSPRSDVEWLLDRIDGGVLVPDHEEAIVQRLGDDRARAIACGHSHVQRQRRLADGRLLLNPGSVGLPAYRGTQPSCYAVHCTVVDARYAVIERIDGVWQARSCAVAYDHPAMARLAARNGFPDWARALASGRA